MNGKDTEFFLVVSLRNKYSFNTSNYNRVVNFLLLSDIIVDELLHVGCSLVVRHHHHLLAFCPPLCLQDFLLPRASLLPAQTDQSDAHTNPSRTRETTGGDWGAVSLNWG